MKVEYMFSKIIDFIFYFPVSRIFYTAWVVFIIAFNVAINAYLGGNSWEGMAKSGKFYVAAFHNARLYEVSEGQYIISDLFMYLFFITWLLLFASGILKYFKVRP